MCPRATAESEVLSCRDAACEVDSSAHNRATRALRRIWSQYQLAAADDDHLC